MFDSSPAVAEDRFQLGYQYAVDHPLDFMLEHIARSLELPRGKREQAIERYLSVGRFLGASDEFAGWDPEIFSQGSFRIGTTTKPWKDSVHDLDLVVRVLPPRGFSCSPSELFNRLYRCLESDGTYAKMLSPMKRCARLTYANDFHLDILPAVPDPGAVGTELPVPDRELRCYKGTNPAGYAAWFKGRTEVRLTFDSLARADSVQPVPSRAETNRPLTRAVQLMKRDRDVYCDHESAEAVISVIVTTLAGHAYTGHSGVYAAIRDILTGIWRMIPAQGRLVVLNPTNPKEDFSERWEQNKAAYNDFLAWLKAFTQDCEELGRLSGIRLQEKLRQMFGESPTETAFGEYGEALRKARDVSTLSTSRAAGLVTLAASQPAVAAVRPHTFHGQGD